MKTLHILPLLTTLLLAACNETPADYDATGIFEATEVTVSAEQNGKILRLDVNEGEAVAKDAEVCLIDTTQLWLKAIQIGAAKEVFAAQRPDIAKQVAATEQQIAKAREECQRYEQLVADGAAGSKTLDDARSQLAVLERQLEQQRSALNTSTNSLNAQMSSTDAERHLIVDQLRRCHISSPIGGTVIEKYMEAGEVAAAGKPLFKVADLNHVFLRAYLTSAQLKNVKLGQSVTVMADFGAGERRNYKGRISWISSKAEFTPKTILTDDERADQVYAAKIAVANDGFIKIGMYGEVKF